MEFIIITIILLYILIINNKVSVQKFVKEAQPYFNFLMEDDYKFLLSVRYGNEVNVEELYGQRVRNGIVATILIALWLLPQLSLLIGLVCLGVGYFVFKQPYMKLQGFYKRNLYHINLMLPYYLKSIEILIQHYTVPVALGKSIKTAPEIFKPGLERLVAKIDEGDASVDPYMDFAKEYPVRDSMRMMRLLYRLGLGSQENKQQQLMMFSRTVSALQNKSREQKYKDRLETMEKMTMAMLFCTGGGIMLILLLAVMMMTDI